MVHVVCSAHPNLTHGAQLFHFPKPPLRNVLIFFFASSYNLVFKHHSKGKMAIGVSAGTLVVKDSEVEDDCSDVIEGAIGYVRAGVTPFPPSPP